MQLTIPTVVAALLPLVATMLSSWLSSDRLPAGVNALTALCALLLTAVVCELLSGAIPLTWPLRFLAILGYVAILMNGDLSVLYRYLVAKPGPIGPKPAPANPNPVRVPTALTLPGTPVPPRASAQDQPKTNA